MRRRMKIYEKEKSAKMEKSTKEEAMEFEYVYLSVLPETTVNKNTSADKECQVKECQFEMEPLTKHTDPGKILMCNRFVTVTIDNSAQKQTITNDAEIQTHIVKAKTLTIPSQKKMKNKCCSTVTKEYAEINH